MLTELSKISLKLGFNSTYLSPDPGTLRIAFGFKRLTSNPLISPYVSSPPIPALEASDNP